MKQNIIISSHLQEELTSAIAATGCDKIFVLTDTTTHDLCWPVVKDYECLCRACTIAIPSGDTNKTLASVQHVWEALQQGGATRHSLLINLGGGMVTDLGGFAAATFKRGIKFINIPTTLLSMVDASVGGKTGFNFGGLKNEIGVFQEATCVILSTLFLKTLDHKNIASGYAEMLKHGLLGSLDGLLSFDLSAPDLTALSHMLEESVKVKERIVNEDPYEKGLRKALNLGHTVGHAFESWSFGKEEILHGYAVAYGMIVELYLSVAKCGFPTDTFRTVTNFIRENYGMLPITCNDYDDLLKLMHHDKKNVGNAINFTLLADVGDIRINQTIGEDEIKEALDFFRDGL